MEKVSAVLAKDIVQEFESVESLPAYLQDVVVHPCFLLVDNAWFRFPKCPGDKPYHQQHAGKGIHQTRYPFGRDSHRPHILDQPAHGPAQDAQEKHTQNDDGKIYLHIFRWPADGRFAVTSTYRAQLVKATLLADPKTVIDGSVTTEGDQTTFSLKLPAQAPDPIASVVCLEVKP
jgi:hypothetical protein